MAWMTAAQLRAFDDGLTNAEVYSDEQLTAVISDVEAELERILGMAYNSRTATDEWHLGAGTQWLRLDHRWPTAITSLSIDGIAVTAGAIAGLIIDRRTASVRNLGGWLYGTDILVTYTHGQSAPPDDLLRAAKLLCRARLGQTRAPFMDRATRYQMDGGGMLVLDQAGAAKTGVPDVDAILARYLVPGIA